MAPPVKEQGAKGDSNDNAIDDENDTRVEQSSLAARRGVPPISVIASAPSSLASSNVASSPPRVTPSTTASTASIFSFTISRRGMSRRSPYAAMPPQQMHQVPSQRHSSPMTDAQQLSPSLLQQQVSIAQQRQQQDYNPWNLDYSNVSTSVASIRAALEMGRQAVGQSSPLPSPILQTTRPTASHGTVESLQQQQQQQQNTPASVVRMPPSSDETDVAMTIMSLSTPRKTNPATERIQQDELVLSSPKPNIEQQEALATPPSQPQDSEPRLSSGKKRKERTRMPTIDTTNTNFENDDDAQIKRQKFD